MAVCRPAMSLREQTKDRAARGPHQGWGIERLGVAQVEGTLEEAEERLCVICLVNERDTTVLPCRHLCMCHDCAQVLPYRPLHSISFCFSPPFCRQTDICGPWNPEMRLRSVACVKTGMQRQVCLVLDKCSLECALLPGLNLNDSVSE